MKTGLTISALVHAALLLWGLISFSARPLEAAPKIGLPVDIISEKEFSEITKGVKNAAKQPEPKPLVEKIGDPKPVDDSSAKVSDKREIKAAKVEAPPPPIPEPRPPEAKPEKKPPPKVDPIAETLKKQEAKKKAEEKAEEKAKAKAAKRQPKRPQPKFDPNQIAALLDKRAPQRHAAIGDTLSAEPSLGYSNGPAARLSQSELDALRRRLVQCWNPPVGAANVASLKVVLRVLFKPDGSVAAPPTVVAGTASTFGPAMAESAKRAILSCQPFTMLRAEHYEQWKDIEITFDPTDMFGG